MKSNIDKLQQQIQMESLRRTVNKIFNTDEFWKWPGSLSHHHDYEGGLAVHTYEVAAELLGISNLCLDIALTAALWHDFGKVRDYAFAPGIFKPMARVVVCDDGCWTQSAYYKKIHHISGSAIEFVVEARKCGVSQFFEDAVVHCILSHHGRPEWGSAIVPRSREALALHFSDMLSAHK